MKTLLITLTLLVAVFTNTIASARTQPVVSSDSAAYKLTVVISEISKRTGKLYIGLATSEATFNGESDRKIAIDVPASGEVSVTFEGLAQGRYAVRLYQDLNNNQKMDFSGQMPAEPFGFSNVTRLMGPPSFYQCAFDLNASKSISVSLIEF